MENITLSKSLTMYNSMVMNPIFKKQADEAAAIIIRNKAAYAAITKDTGVPYYMIGLIHMQECSFSFSKHLHNGDPLTARTVQVPKGRPIDGHPAFTFTESAIDALRFQGYAAVRDWSVANCLLLLEKYNGMGYRKQGINSPYLWSGCQFYTKGKFVADHGFKADFVSQQCGVALVLKALGIV